MQRDGHQHPTTLILTMHKAASSFLAGNFALAAQALYPGLQVVRYGMALLRGSTPSDMPLPPTGVLVTRIYPDLFDSLMENPASPKGRFADKKMIMVIRDPRDAAVSLYYSTAFSHNVPPGKSDEFLSLRNELRATGLMDGIRRHTAASAILEFKTCLAFLKQHSHTLNVPYEMLVTDFAGWFSKVVGYLDWPRGVVSHLGPQLARDVQPPRVVDANQHKRRVTPGNWREVFDDQLCHFFDEQIGAEMTAAGYAWDHAAAVG